LFESCQAERLNYDPARMAHAAFALGTIAVATVALGWQAGFRALTGYLLFWMQAVAVVVTAVRLVRSAFPWQGLLDAVLRTAVIAFALIVLTGFVLGAGLIGPTWYLVAAGAGLAASAALPPATRRLPIDDRRIPIYLAVLICPMLAFVVAAGIAQSPPTLYDSLSYHLLFPARWLQEHRLFIMQTPFSDEAQAYAPANGELFFLWLMAPFHGDVMARIGQLPFYLATGAALYGLSRRLGAVPAHAAYVPAFYFLSRPVVEQAAGADVDLICWAMFLTSLYLGFVALERNHRRDWTLWGVSVGLYAGTKYVSLVYGPLLLALPLLAGLRRPVLWSAPGLALFAAPWYLRNWIVAGSPIYPSSFGLAGLTIAQGAFSRAAMNLSVFHTTDPRLLPVMLSHAFGTLLILVWAPFALAGARRMASAQPRREALFLVLAPLAMVPLYWFGVPDNIDSRFLLPEAMLALVPLAFVFRASRAWNAAIHLLYAAGLVWLVVGLRAELPARLPWFMSGWLALDGIVAHASLVPFFAIALVSAAVAYTSSRFALPILTAVAAAASVVLSAGSAAWCGADRCGLLSLSSTFIRPTMIDGWRWVAAHVGDSTIANTGNNLPYPLAGDHLRNRVLYVNIDRHVDWRFHDYDRAHRRRRGDAPPIDPLAVPSGVLLPLPGPPRWHVDAVRPRYERLAGDRSAWIANLKLLGVDRLFVSALSAYEIDYVAHNAGGFPIEDDWARGEPSAFTPLYENGQIRIYAVHPP
jgi:hypothetical protein